MTGGQGGESPPQVAWALGVEYDGGVYSGWQRQRDVPSVQETLETALGQVANQRVRTVAAGRTDAGVHATKQVVSFATTARRPLQAWREGVNSLVGDRIKVRWARAVDAEFHARYSASSRHYVYLFRMDTVPAPLSDPFAWRVSPLCTGAVHRAAQCLAGEHDFTSFRAAGCQSRSCRRKVHRIAFRTTGEIGVLNVEANAFLLHMVRNIAGALVQVGDGRRPESWIGDCLRARDRRRIGMTAPARGLYLVDVQYPGYDFPAGRLPPLLSGLESLDGLPGGGTAADGRNSARLYNPRPSVPDGSVRTDPDPRLNR